jgi:uncharacterized protein YndB with AHSA1/START domain
MLSDEKTKTIIDRDTFTIRFQRQFGAPCDQVFAAWTEPEHITHWWDPTGAPLSECVIDLRPGGTFKFTNQDSAHSPPFTGVYRVVERPSELVFEVLGAVGTVHLESKDGTTHMTVSIRCASGDHLAQFLKIGVDVNTDRTLDNLVNYVRKAR